MLVIYLIRVVGFVLHYLKKFLINSLINKVSDAIKNLILNHVNLTLF